MLSTTCLCRGLAVPLAAVKTALSVLHSALHLAVGPRAPAGGRGSFLSTTERVGLPPPASVSSLGAFTILRQLRRPHGFTPSFISLVCVNHNELPQTGPQLIAICLHSGGWKAKMEMPAWGGGAVISEATAHSQMLSLRRVLMGRARRGGALCLFSQGQESHREAPPS